MASVPIEVATCTACGESHSTTLYHRDVGEKACRGGHSPSCECPYEWYFECLTQREEVVVDKVYLGGPRLFLNNPNGIRILDRKGRGV